MLTVLGKSQAEERVQLPAQARPTLERFETTLDPPSDDWPVIPKLYAPTLHGLLPNEVEPDEDQTILEVLRERNVALPALTTDGARKLSRRLCEDGEISVEGDHEYLTPHGARRGAGEAVYRAADVEASQRVLRHAEPLTMSAIYPHIDAGELAEGATTAFEDVDDTLTGSKLSRICNAEPTYKTYFEIVRYN